MVANAACCCHVKINRKKLSKSLDDSLQKDVYCVCLPKVGGIYLKYKPIGGSLC